MNKTPNLINKYNIPGPRYTSYPTVPYWDEKGISFEQWKSSLKKAGEKNKNTGLSLYIHLPYCESLCTFCGCHKHITKQHSVEAPYIDAVIKEWKLYNELFNHRIRIKEIHLGGGTPTFFNPKNIEKLIKGILSLSDKANEYEFGFEAHPNNTTKEHLQKLYCLGFRRVSFGVQEYDYQIQKSINRIQSFETVKKVHDWAKSVGYTSISHDLVFGLPHQTKETILDTICLTNMLRPDRISLYSYAHVPWVKGVGQRGFNELNLPSPEVKREMYDASKKALIKNGYIEIGMDHFALKEDDLYKAHEKKTLHRNFMGYTANKTQILIGLGMSAISDSWYGFAQNVKTVKEYIEIIDRNKIPIFKGHLLSSEDLLIRKHILNLMCNFETSWNDEFKGNKNFQIILKRLKPLIIDGLVVVKDNHLMITKPGRVFVRNVCMCFDQKLISTQNKDRIFSKTI